MGASASLQSNELSVAPGSEAQLELRVRNTGTVVDQFTFTPIGTAQGWITVEPPQVSLFPGAEETVRVLFRPPRAHTTVAGPSPFAVKVNSREDPEGSVVEEGVVHVEAFDDRTIELIPHTSTGSRRAKHSLAIDNRGNARANLQLAALDPNDELTFAIEPGAVTVEPGTAQFADVVVRPRKRFWRGNPVTKPFVVQAVEEGKEPISVDGALLQHSILPKWLWKALLGLLLLLLLLGVLWFTLLKPSINSQAKDAAKQQVAPVEDRLNAAGVPTIPPNAPVKPGAGGSTTIPPPSGGGSATTAAPGATTTAPPGGGSSSSGNPFDIRLVASTPIGGTPQPGQFTVPAGKTYSMTDIVLQNPNGDQGRLQILRDTDVLFDSALENFRDLDYHFVAPYVFNAGQNLTVVIQTCKATGQEGGSTCTAAASFSGFLK